MNILDNNLKLLIEECALLKNKISEQVKDICITVSSPPESVKRVSAESLEDEETHEEDRELQN
jgi:hypothetical protein